MKPRIFISAVSEEFATLRDRHIDPLLRKMGYEPITMTVFPTGHGDLRQWLRDQIDPCEGLIQLAGVAYGREPPIVADDIDRMSYTQFELHHALRSGKKVWVFTATDAATRDRPVSELDLPPPGTLVDDTVAYQNERHELQRRYHEWLKDDGLLRHPFGDAVTLENRLHNIGDELHELYRQWAEMQAQIRTIVANTTTTRVRSGRLLALVLLLLPLLVGVGLLAAPQVSCRLPGVARLCTYFQVDKPNKDIGDIKILLESLVVERAQSVTVTGVSDVRSPEALRTALEDIVETREGQQALQRFQQGEEADALRDLDRLRAAQARSVANLALTALARGKVTVGDVVFRYDEVIRLDLDALWDRIELTRLLQQAGQTTKAKRIADDALALAEARLQVNPDSADAQRDVSVSLDNLGSIQANQGDTSAALAAYQRSLAICEALAASDPSNAQAQRDVSVSLNNIGGIRVLQGDTSAALVAYQRSLTINEALAASDPSNAQAQRDVIVSHANLWQIATDRPTEARHAHEIDRIFTALDTLGAHISPVDRSAWDKIRQWLRDHQ